MQTSKFLLGIGVAIVLSIPPHALAKTDTEEQAKMREALRLKMEELSAQDAKPAAVPGVSAPVAEVAKPESKPVKPKQVESKPKTVVVPVPMEAPTAAPAKSKFSDPDVILSEAAATARVREALAQKMSEMNAKPAVAVETPAPAMKPVPVAKPQAPTYSAPLVAPAATVVVPAPKPTQIEAPVSTLPVNKQGRLAELLRRYKADEITAQDYHSQRAAILAQ